MPTLLVILYNTRNKKIKKEVGIALKSKKASNKLASYQLWNHWLPTLKATLATIFETHSIANLQDLDSTLTAIIIGNTNYKIQSRD